MMKRLLISIGLWLARCGGWAPEPPCTRMHTPGVPLGRAARTLVIWAEEAFPGTSGEHKRHQVYARLLREHPTASRRDVALSIELALQ